MAISTTCRDTIRCGPVSHSACLTQMRIAFSEQPKSCASCRGIRPPSRFSRTASAWNSSAYPGRGFLWSDRQTPPVQSNIPRTQVSAKPGQL